MFEELSATIRGLGQSDGDNRLAQMQAALACTCQEFVGIADLEGNGLFVNEAGRRLIGLPDLDAVRSTRIIDCFAEDDKPRVLHEVFPAVRKTGYWEGELRFRNFETGETIPVLYNIFPIRDSSGAIAAYGTVTRNLTGQKRAEQRLRSLASIIESSDDAILGKNLDGIVASWNQGAERIYGYTAEEMIGQSVTVLIPADRQDEEIEILGRIRRGDRIDHFETLRQRKDGSIIVVSLTISPVKDADGNIVGASTIGRDITQRKRNEEKIATLAREAEHRGKNLLASVQAVVSLSRADTPEGLKEAIEGRIKALADVHSLFVESRWVGAELSAIARQELAPYSEKNQKSVRIDGPRTVLAPNAARAIAMTLHELATNAAKYGSLSAAEGHVDLTWQRGTDGQVILRWAEASGPVVRKPARRGFGSRVVEGMIGQVQGKARFDWRPEGLVCEITLQV